MIGICSDTFDLGQAHNLKFVGSNPTPATKAKRQQAARFAADFLYVLLKHLTRPIERRDLLDVPGFAPGGHGVWGASWYTGCGARG